MNMQIGFRYIVTKASSDKTFQAGDQVGLCKDGSLMNWTAGGWQDLDDIPATTKGWEVTVDRDWASARLKKLYEEIELIQKAIK